MKQPYRLPPELSPAAPRRTHDDLGALVSEHRARVTVAPTFAAIVLVFLAVPYLGSGRYELLALYACVFVLALRLLLTSLARAWKPAIEIWDRGLVVKRRWTHPRTIRFEDVDAIFYDMQYLRVPFTSPSVGIAITTHAGGRLALPSDLDATDKIVSSLDRRVTRALLAPAKRAFADGERLVFRPLVLEGDRIVVRAEEPLLLDDLDCVEARPHEIRLYRRGQDWPPFASVPLHAIPHPRVLLTVLATRVPVEDATGLPT